MMEKTTTDSVITAVVGEVIRLHRPTMRPDLLSDLVEELTRQNPQYHMMSLMQRRNPYQHLPMPAQVIKSIQVGQQGVNIPRGCARLLRELAKKHGQSINWIDQRLSFPRNPEMRMIDGFELLPYQKTNLAGPLTRQQGVIEMPCGGGKTVFGIALAMTIAQPTLILVHTHDLLNQWVGELGSKAVVPGGVGVVGAGAKTPREVTVATIQTLARMDPNTLRELLDRFGCIMLDECHHCPATTFLGIMNKSKSRFRFGFTATAERKDGLQFLMHDTIGATVASVTDSDLEAAGRSQSVTVKEVRTGFFTEHTADQWAKLIAELTQDDDRNRLIIEKVVESWHEGHFPLILSDRVGHCRLLCSALQRAGMNAVLLIGEVPKNTRDRIMRDSRVGLIDAIVATKVADEGLDIPNLSCLHLVTPSANRAKTQQRVGRIRRPVEGKVSVLYDYVDPRVTSCARMFRERRRFYREWGFSWFE